MVRKQKLSDFRLAEFGPDGPSLRTLRKWCEDGEITEHYLEGHAGRMTITRTR